MNFPNRKIYQFGECRLDPGENLLLRDGVQLSLKPKEFATLLFLVENQGSLVERSALMENIWGDSFVEEAAISKCIWSIRNALGDNSKDQSIIQTVPKRGYRFVAPVEIIETDISAKPLSVHNDTLSLPSDVPRREQDLHDHDEDQLALATAAVPQRSGFRYIFIFGAAAVTLFLILSVTLRAPRSSDESIKIAVLPLRPVNIEDKDTAIASAVTEAIINKLVETRYLKIIPLYSVRKFNELSDGALAAGLQLQADHVIDSTYQIADGKIRVTSQLLNVRSGEVEDVIRSETDSSNIFKLQDVVSNEIGNAVLRRLGKAATTFASEKGTDNEEAYALYHDSRYLLDKLTLNDSLKAIEFIDRAIALDPKFAHAWAVKAQALCLSATLGGGEPANIYKIAEPVLEQAFSLNNRLSLAYTVRGSINRDFHWNFPSAYSDLSKAIELDPNNVIAHRYLAGLYLAEGKFDDAVAEQAKTVDLNPASVIDQWYLGELYYGAGRYDESVAHYERAATYAPTWPSPHSSLWRVYHMKGEHEKAFSQFILSRELQKTPQANIENYKAIYHQNGWPAVLRSELEARIQEDPKDKHTGMKYSIALAAAAVGDNDTAFSYLEDCLKYRVGALMLVKTEPLFADLRKDSRYKDFIARANF